MDILRLTTSTTFGRQYGHLETAGLTLSLSKTTLTPLSEAPAEPNTRDQCILEALRQHEYWKYIAQTSKDILRITLDRLAFKACGVFFGFSLQLQRKVPKLMQLWYMDDATLIGNLDDIQAALTQISECMDLSGPDLEVTDVT